MTTHDDGADGPVEPDGSGALTVDCLGRPCPVPVIELARALPTVQVGALVRVLADDPAARLDLPAWCRMRAQEYLGEAPEQVFTVRRLN